MASNTFFADFYQNSCMVEMSGLNQPKLIQFETIIQRHEKNLCTLEDKA